MPDTDATPPESIAARTIGEYLDTLGSSDPTPGGGSVAGVVGALGAGLAQMVISLTNTNDTDAKEHLGTTATLLDDLRQRFTDLAEQDETVFQAYRDAAALPKEAPEERSVRRVAMQQALKHAASVPLEMCEAAVRLGQALVPVQQYGNPYLLSDARVAALCASTCFEASRVNVNVNLAMIKDDAWITDVANKVESLAEDLHRHLHAV